MAHGFRFNANGHWLPVAPGAELDYSVEWADWLGADTLQTVVWSIATGLTMISQNQNSTQATIWLKGFVVGVTYEVSCSIVTAGSRKDTRFFNLICKKR